MVLKKLLFSFSGECSKIDLLLTKKINTVQNQTWSCFHTKFFGRKKIMQKVLCSCQLFHHSLMSIFSVCCEVFKQILREKGRCPYILTACGNFICSTCLHNLKFGQPCPACNKHLVESAIKVSI